MKVLLLNGSPHANGTTAAGLGEMMTVFEKEGIETELIHVGHLDIRSCVVCDRCFTLGKCVFDDIVNELAGKFRDADGLVVGSPVYYASANATLIALLTRLWRSTPFSKTMKVGAAVACARRAGTVATVDELNKFFLIKGMPIASGQYWNGVHGNASAESAREDEEGLQQMRTLAHNMAFLMRSIALGREKYGIPEPEPRIRTNFVR